MIYFLTKYFVADNQISIILTWLNQLCKCSCWNT